MCLGKRSGRPRRPMASASPRVAPRDWGATWSVRVGHRAESGRWRGLHDRLNRRRWSARRRPIIPPRSQSGQRLPEQASWGPIRHRDPSSPQERRDGRLNAYRGGTKPTLSARHFSCRVRRIADRHDRHPGAQPRDSPGSRTAEPREPHYSRREVASSGCNGVIRFSFPRISASRARQSDRPKPAFREVFLDGDRRSDGRYLEMRLLGQRPRYQEGPPRRPATWGSPRWGRGCQADRGFSRPLGGGHSDLAGRRPWPRRTPGKGTPVRSKLFGSHGQRPWFHEVMSAPAGCSSRCAGRWPPTGCGRAGRGAWTSHD
jgi:hypothetical protein